MERRKENVLGGAVGPFSKKAQAFAGVRNKAQAKGVNGKTPILKNNGPLRHKGQVQPRVPQNNAHGYRSQVLPAPPVKKPTLPALSTENVYQIATPVFDENGKVTLYKDGQPYTGFDKSANGKKSPSIKKAS